tara:strand:- start:146 stop:586 length:441 start_codon:yes stop_codon:yes gene_type:complete
MILDNIKAELKQAMKSGNKNQVLAIRNILEKIKIKQVDSNEPLHEKQIIQIISKYAKQLRESIEQFTKGSRMDLVEKESEELKIVKQFLPTQMSKSEIKTIVLESIKITGAENMRDMGKVMKMVLDKTQGSADGKIISNLVKEHLI